SSIMSPASKPATRSKALHRRSLQACLICRSRKVRCDVSVHGQPCTNCSLDDKECQLSQAPAGWSQKASERRALRNTSNATNIRNSEIAPTVTEQLSLDSQISLPQLTSSSFPLQTVGAGEPWQNWHMDSLDFASIPEPAAYNSWGSSMSTDKQPRLNPIDPISNNKKGNIFQQSTGSPTDTGSTKDGVVLYSYFQFLTVGNLHAIPYQDVSYLEAQGCLHVPNPLILDVFMRAYFTYAHVFKPLVDEGEFWEMCSLATNDSPRTTMSLLVLRAMLFASSTLLFDMEAETAHLPLAQAALMLMNWVPESPATTSPVPYRTWLSLAIHHAKLVNAHRHAGICDVGTTANEPRSRTLRRLWWCCIICDRLSSLTCRFRLQITPDMLDMENCVPLGFADLQSEIHRSNVFSPATKRQLISLFSKYLGLLMLLTELIPVAYPFETRLESSPDFSVKEEENIRKSCDLLDEWYDTTKAEFPPFHQLKAAEESDSVNSVAVHTNLMYIYYQVFTQISGTGSSDFHRGDYEDGDRSNEIRGDIEDSVLGLSYEDEVVPSHLKGWPLLGLDPMHKHLHVVVDAADTFSAQYYGSQWVKEAAEHVAKLAKSFNKLSLQSGQEAMKDWVDILVRYPETYLGLVWTVDMCVSRRKLPEAQDFPLCLRNDVERLNAAPRETEHEMLDSRSLDGQKDLQLTQSLDYLLGIQEPMVDVI
ncbi:Cutinase transcription factor 1 beta, partial [Fusarium oxysporum f. sp. cubense race 1]